MDPRLFPDTKCGGETQVASSESATASSRIQRGINATAILQSTSTWTLNVPPPVDSLNLQKRNKNGQCRHGMRSSTWAVWADIASGRQFRQMCLFRRSIVSYNSLLNQIQFKIQFEKNWRQIGNCKVTGPGANFKFNFLCSKANSNLNRKVEWWLKFIAIWQRSKKIQMISTPHPHRAQNARNFHSNHPRRDRTSWPSNEWN